MRLKRVASPIKSPVGVIKQMALSYSMYFWTQSAFRVFAEHNCLF